MGTPEPPWEISSLRIIVMGDLKKWKQSEKMNVRIGLPRGLAMLWRRLTHIGISYGTDCPFTAISLQGAGCRFGFGSPVASPSLMICSLEYTTRNKETLAQRLQSSHMAAKKTSKKNPNPQIRSRNFALGNSTSPFRKNLDSTGSSPSFLAA